MKEPQFWKKTWNFVIFSCPKSLPFFHTFFTQFFDRQNFAKSQTKACAENYEVTNRWTQVCEEVKSSVVHEDEDECDTRQSSSVRHHSEISEFADEAGLRPRNNVEWWFGRVTCVVIDSCEFVHTRRNDVEASVCFRVNRRRVNSMMPGVIVLCGRVMEDGSV